MGLSSDEKDLLKAVTFKESDLESVRELLDDITDPKRPPPYVFPEYCSRCFSRKGDTSFGIWYDFLTTSTGATSVTTWRTGEVPICTSCKDEVYNSRTRMMRRIYVGVFLAGIFVTLLGVILGRLTGQEFPSDSISSIIRLLGYVVVGVGLFMSVFLIVFPRLSGHRYMAWAMRPVARLNPNTGVIEFGNREFAARVRELNPNRRFE